MASRALLFSLLAHGLLLIGIFYFINQRQASIPESESLIQAPLGSVFVQMEGLRKAKENAPPSFSSAGDVSQSSQGQSNEDPEILLEKNSTSGSAVFTSTTAGLLEGEAQPIGHIEPSYPPLSRKFGEEGEAIFRLEIAADGKVITIELEKSSGYPRLDQSAREALAGASFIPSRTNGEAVRSRKRMRIEFRLKRYL